ncbi:MAG: hypothetical protein ABIX01_07830 [Chitinophagaceae bacterium]
MTLKKFLIFFAITVAAACSSSDNYPPVENSLDAGRQFIDAVFKGNFKRAGMLLLDDAKNEQLLKEKMEDAFHNRSSEDRNELKQSSITILATEDVVKDSITIINFMNSYDHKPAVLKVVKQNGNWVIDLKYTFSGNL